MYVCVSYIKSWLTCKLGRLGRTAALKHINQIRINDKKSPIDYAKLVLPTSTIELLVPNSISIGKQ